ncbi:12977_t:CDS:1 [Cetraspora pellucida]|uniref:12977_t:CDS:1 n=1 Tax=Cetraspora pellucida TaxID=1433469 RepID=A0A9N9BCN9_9GLOM|nr:12977_t:CDS:1 [Cetraspora pellucida]
MARGQKKPEITERRNGVQNYIKFMRDFYPHESPFPVQEDCLKKYIDYKVKAGKLQTQYLTLYVTNIKAHNEALGFGWAFGASIKEALAVASSNLGAIPLRVNASNVISLPTDINSSNLDISLQGEDSFNALCNSQQGLSYDQNSPGFTFQDVPTDNALNMQANVTLNDDFPYNMSPCDAHSLLPPGINAPNIIPLHTEVNPSNLDASSLQGSDSLCNSTDNIQSNITQNDDLSPCDARPFLPAGITASNIVPLPTDINSYIQPTHLRSNQFYTQRNNFPTVPTDNTYFNDNFLYNMSPCDAHSRLPPEINAPNVIPLHTDVNPSNLDASSLQGSDSLCNSTDNHIQAYITQNDDLSPCDARPFLPAGITASNIVPLPTDINSYIQPTHLRSNQFYTQRNNFPTVPTDNTYFKVKTNVTQNINIPYNLSTRDARPFHPPRINVPNNIPLHIDTQSTCIIPNNNFIYSQSFPDAHLSLQPEINVNFQNSFFNRLHNPNIDVQELEKQNFISTTWKRISDAQREIAYLYYLIKRIR